MSDIWVCKGSTPKPTSTLPERKGFFVFLMHLGFFSFPLPFRKGALLMNNIIAILASILMGISFPTGLFELLIAGRFLIGINSGESFPILTSNKLH